MLQLEKPTVPPGPVVFDSPHSGSDYPEDFRPAIDKSILRRAEDAHVDALFNHVMLQGAALLSASFPRSYIDTNRPVDDLDPDLIEGDWPHPINPSAKSFGGKGLIWRTVQLSGAIYDRKLTVDEVARRIENYWQPYHDALRALLDETYVRHGMVLHINCHSMRSRGHEKDPDGEVDRPDIILGDRVGVSCDPKITQFAAQTLRDLGYSVSVNSPYQGQELVRAYAAPAIGRHSFMIEINRRLYMDERTLEVLPSFDVLKRNMTAFTQAIISHFREAK